MRLLLLDHSYQPVRLPIADDSFSVHAVKHAAAVDEIVFEAALKALPVAELEHPAAPLVVVVEISLIVYPAFLRLVEVCVIVWLVQLEWFFVVEDALTFQGIVAPISLIGDTAISVIQRSFSVHLVIVPVSAVFPSLSVVESAIAASQTIHFSTLVIALCKRLLHKD